MTCIALNGMTWISERFTRLTQALDGVESEGEFFLRLGIAAGIVLVVILLRNKISRGILALLCGLTRIRKPILANGMQSALAKPLALFLSAASLWLGCRIMTPGGEWNKTGMYILQVGLILSVCWGALRYLNHELTRYAGVTDEDMRTKQTVFRFVANVGKILIVCIGVLLVLELFGFKASRIFAALGIGGVAVAFACKDAVENLISGFIIVFNKPFRVGDYITVGELSGTVEDIKVRATTLRALDGSRYVLPNTGLTNKAITNFAEMEKRLVEETFCLHYKHTAAEIDAFGTALRALLVKNENVVPDDIRIDFTAFGAHGMDISVFFYLNKTVYAAYLQEKSHINMQIKNLLDEMGIELAYNSASVYLENNGGRA